MKEGITLVEIIGVLVIIGIVAVVLYPVFFLKCHTPGYQTACTSNQKQIATAFMIYVQDNDETIPQITVDIFSVLGLSGKVLDCKVGKSQKVRGSYVVNGTLSNVTFDDIINPVTLWLTADGKKDAVPVGYTSDDMDPRHAGGAIVSFLDSHVASIRNLADITETFAAKPLTPSVENIWNAETGVFTPVKKNAAQTIDYDTTIFVDLASEKPYDFMYAAYGVFLNDLAFNIGESKGVDITLQFYISANGKTKDLGKPHTIKLTEGRKKNIFRTYPFTTLYAEGIEKFVPEKESDMGKIEIKLRMKISVTGSNEGVELTVPGIDIIRYGS